MRREMSLKWLFLGSLITNTGISFIWPLTTIYMHEYLNEPLTVAGIVLFFNSVAMMIGNYIGGRLFDKWKPYQTLLIGITLAVVTSGLLIVWHGWPAYPILLVIMGLGNGIIATAINSFATVVRSRQTSYVFNVLYFMSNLGLVIGTLVVGYVLPLGIQYVFMIAFALFILFFVVGALHFNITIERHASAEQVKTKSRKNAHQWSILLLLITLFVIWVAYEQWQSNISAFMITLGMDVRDYSFLWTLNAVLVVLGQPVLTAFDSWLLDHIRLRLVTGFILFTSAFVILMPANHYWQFILAMAVLTLGEILALPAVSTYVDLYTNQSEKGRYQGFVQMFASAGRAVGPLIGALIIDWSGYFNLFVILTVVMLLSIVVFGVRAQREHQLTQE